MNDYLLIAGLLLTLGIVLFFLARDIIASFHPDRRKERAERMRAEAAAERAYPSAPRKYGSPAHAEFWGGFAATAGWLLVSFGVLGLGFIVIDAFSTSPQLSEFEVWYYLYGSFGQIGVGMLFALLGSYVRYRIRMDALMLQRRG